MFKFLKFRLSLPHYDLLLVFSAGVTECFSVALYSDTDFPKVLFSFVPAI